MKIKLNEPPEELLKKSKTNYNTTIRVSNNTAYRFNLLKITDRFINQDIFLKYLLDLFENQKK